MLLGNLGILGTQILFKERFNLTADRFDSCLNNTV